MIDIPYIWVNGEKMHKTHLPYEWWKKYLNKKRDRVIFLYGDVVDSVISTKLNRNEPNHFKNCGYVGEPKDIFREDFLGYGHLFDSWGKFENVLYVRYEKIPQMKQEIEDFLGFNFELNTFKKRESTENLQFITDDDIKHICKTYASLIKKTETYDEK